MNISEYILMIFEKNKGTLSALQFDRWISVLLEKGYLEKDFNKINDRLELGWKLTEKGKSKVDEIMKHKSNLDEK
jgi:DNA-binding MarR family transcriptional regulator